ncbi:DUF6392 family protein [Pseudomonas fluorescens]|uniref:Pyocin immunity protein n=1 Tax=Pseudomonas fluorescens TaxID=294 RepID=A0A5E7DUJ0_PSEFL|nr:DUF6392 family protein [Pseudomonas fluorescens]VVO12154.1 hypothetical protein PS710_03539 [Pseudomonas fluorescens]
MNATTIEHWIKKIGQTYEALIAEGSIPDKPLNELYPGRDWLAILPAPGLELSFWAETKRFEKLFITFLEGMPGVSVYKGGLPEPYTSEMTQSDARAIFGEPLESRGPIKMPQPMGQTGGWESYQLDPVRHPNIKVVFQYTTSMQVDVLVFTLIEKDHD